MPAMLRIYQELSGDARDISGDGDRLMHSSGVERVTNQSG